MSCPKSVEFKNIYRNITTNDIRILQSHFGTIEDAQAYIAPRLKENVLANRNATWRNLIACTKVRIDTH